METWFSKNLGNGADAFAPTIAMQNTFIPLFARIGQPHDMALFSWSEPKSHDVIIYFSPAAAQMAGMYGATPCERPSRQGLSLLVGDQRCWGLLYPAS